MSNIQISNIDLGRIALETPVDCRDGLLTAAGADTFDEGTILAVDSVSLKYVPYVKGGATNENGVPKAILQYTLEVAGAGDYAIRPIIGGKVNLAQLVIHADGNNDNIDVAVLDELRDYGIFAVDTTELCKLDNQ